MLCDYIVRNREKKWLEMRTPAVRRNFGRVEDENIEVG